MCSKKDAQYINIVDTPVSIQHNAQRDSSWQKLVKVCMPVTGSDRTSKMWGMGGMINKSGTVKVC